MANSGQRRIGATNYPGIAPDDLLSDELPDYSSRRSSYNDQKVNPYDVEERNRKVSTASNMLEVPGLSKYERQNSVGSMASLVSNSSANTFSYRNFGKAKIKNAFGSIIVFIGLALLVLGALFLIFGHQPSVNNVITVDITPNANTTSNSTTGSDNGSNHPKYKVSAFETIGYFALFLGILLILIGLSIICREVKPTAKQNQSPNIRVNIPPKRRVSTIEIEPHELAINKPEIMITTDNFKESVSYRKNESPEPNLLPRASFSQEYDSNPKSFNEYQKRFPF